MPFETVSFREEWIGRASVGAAKKFARTTLSAELSHETSDNLDTPQAQGPITRRADS